MRALTAFLLLTLVSMHTAQECDTPLFREVVAPDDTKTRFTLDNIGETDPGFVTGLPLINSSHPLVIREGDFTIPTLLLAGRDNLSPHFWLTALDLQQGPAGANCWSSAVVQELSVELREANGYRALDVPFREGRDPANSNPTLNLKELGGAAGGRVVRLSFPPMGADGIRINVLSIDPLSSSVSTEVCLRVEVYGCEKTDNTPPAVNTGPLYQYNLAQPTAELYGNRYTDPGYTGITSSGYLSGGTGLLSDGTVGVNAAGESGEWVGWARNRTAEIEVLFLFKRRQEINRISLFYWEERGVGVGSADFTDHNNSTIPFDSVVVRNITSGLRQLIYTRDTMTGVSYVKLRVCYSADGSVVLLTEIEMSAVTNGHEFNVIRGRNSSQLIYMTSLTTEGRNSTREPTTTTTTTPTATPTATQTATTTTTTTQTATTTTTTAATQTATTQTATTTQTTTTQTATATTAAVNITSLSTNNTTISSELSKTVPTHTIPTTVLPGRDTYLLSGVSASLLLSVCLNALLVLSLGVCCWRCLKRRGTFVVQGRDYKPTDEGTYVPMSSLQLPSYHNILEADTADSSREQSSSQSLSETHYYSVLEEMKGETRAEAGKYYQFR